jgi:hypothetical protein
MNIKEQQQAVARLQQTWQFFFGDLGFSMEPAPRQYLTWINLYGESWTEKGMERANTWVNKVHTTSTRRVTFTDVVAYASACARDMKKEASRNVDSQPAAT